MRGGGTRCCRTSTVEWVAAAGRWNTRISATTEELAADRAARRGAADAVRAAQAAPEDAPPGARGVRVLRYTMPEATGVVTGSRSSRSGGNRGSGSTGPARPISEVGDRVSELALPLVAVTVLDAGPGRGRRAVRLPSGRRTWSSLFVGAWVDRLPSKRRMLVIANLVQAASHRHRPARARRRTALDAGAVRRGRRRRARRRAVQHRLPPVLRAPGAARAVRRGELAALDDPVGVLHRRPTAGRRSDPRPHRPGRAGGGRLLVPAVRADDQPRRRRGAAPPTRDRTETYRAELRARASATCATTRTCGRPWRARPR